MKTIIYISLLSSLFLLGGCGDQVENLGGNPPPIMGAPDKGVFINKVDGLEYTRTLAPVAQLTDNASTYSYRTGEIVNFHIGNLDIGDAIGLSVITPKEIVIYKNLELNTSIYSYEVNNRVRLLMSLDEDNNITNGIKISSATRTAAKNWTTPDYSVDDTAFIAEVASATGGNVNITVSTDAAEVQFAKELRCVYSGAYSGNWILESGAKTGFVGVMIQASNTQDPHSNLGTIVTLGDGQDLNGDGNYDEFLFARGTHNMDTGYYDFNETGEFNVTAGSIVPSSQVVKGDGSSISYNNVKGSFTQTDPVTNITSTGNYEAIRVGEGLDPSYRYTGFGYDNNTSDKNTTTDPILGLFTFDVDSNGTVLGLIHDARNNEEPSLKGMVDFNTTSNNISMSLTYPNNGGTFLIKGTLAFDGTVNLDWFDENGTVKYGYIDGVGCQLQPHN